jgi:8-oxo-dGTP diphosphatase
MDTRVYTAAVIMRDDKTLIVKRAATQRFAPNQWEFVSGFMEENETAEQTILRELKEEIGCEAKIIQSLSVYEVTDDEGRWVVVPFLVEIPESSAITLSQEHSDFMWVVKEELSRLPELADDVKALEGQLRF